MDAILSSQMPPAIKIGLGFYESIEGESSSESKTRNSNEKYKILTKSLSPFGIKGNGKPRSSPSKSRRLSYMNS